MTYRLVRILCKPVIPVSRATHEECYQETKGNGPLVQYREGLAKVVDLTQQVKYCGRVRHGGPVMNGELQEVLWCKGDVDGGRSVGVEKKSP
jgi:hypothetical protein